MRRQRAQRRSRLLVASGLAAVGLVLPLATSSAGASPPTDGLSKLVKPIDKQRWENPDSMRWSDYEAVPDTAWADTAESVASIRNFKIAVVLGDFTDQPFLITQPEKSHPFGNPQKVSGVPENEVAKFYEDFLNKPSKLNHGHTLNEYWMEDTYGEYGVDLTGFGVYHLPGKMHEYGLNDVGQGGQGCPTGDVCNKSIRSDLGSRWIADVGQEVADEYELIFYLTAGHDESGTWQEFGEMKFLTRDDVPEEFGPPQEERPNWIVTRYVPWTSWLAGAGQWPNAGGGSSTQSESSGSAVYAHELSHLFGIGDNYGNPYGVPVRRDYTGPWDMMSRGSFNGPFGPHNRWVVPARKSATMGSHHTLRTKIRLDVLDEDQYLRLSRNGLDDSGLVMMDVTARAVPVGDEAGRPGSIGFTLAMETGDLAPPCNPAEDYTCDGRGYNNYTVEVVDRMGSDSFTPDSGVMISKTKNADSAPWQWVIDANPQDIDLVDFTRPDGTKAKVSLGDYRQLSDALFHAGTNSGSEYEYRDQANRLQFYVLDKMRDADGVLSYRVAVRSLDGDGPHKRGVEVSSGAASTIDATSARCTFSIENTGVAKDVSGSQPEDVSDLVDADVYRLSATADTGTSFWLPRKIVGVDNGDTTQVEVRIAKTADEVAKTLKLKVVSESDPSVKGTASCRV